MSTNHNRIKVADLETNQPNKILKTNLNGELEFSDVSNLKTENYNALDYTSEGKALDARQGKVLKDMIENNNFNLASDSETQITNSVTEDNKIVSRSKLFNWWNWVVAQTQIIKAVWNFSKGLKVSDSTSNYTTEMLQDMFVAKLNQANNGVCKAEYGFETVKWSTANGYSTLLKPIAPNQNRTLTLPNKSGTISIINDFVKTAAGTITTPSLIIPNGSLTTTPQNGAIERDENGQLWETHNGVRYKLLNTLDASLFVAKENLPTDIVNNDITTTIPTKLSLNLLYPDIPVGTYIHFTKIQSNPNFPVTYRKTTFGWIMFGFTQIIQ